jgi:pilus assembly protein CpaD
MLRSLPSLLVLPLALLAGACSSSFEDRYQAALPVEQRLPIEVSTQTAVLDIATDASGRVTAQSRSDIAAFLRSYKADNGSSLEIQTGAGGRVAAQTEGEVRDLAAIYGIPRNRVRVTAYVPEPGARGGVRIAYARLVASVPACENPDWSENLAMTWDNTTYANFGCATQKNLAAMAGDKRDLIQARAMDPASAEKRDAATAKYEKGLSPSSARTEGDSGKVSDVTSGTERK